MSATVPPDAFLSSTNFTTTNTANNISSQETKESPFQNLNSSLLIIILILCITLLVSLSLCLLLRLLNRRCFRQFSPPSTTATTTTTTITSSSNRYSGSGNNRVSPENPESSIADTLPLFSFSSIKRRSSTAAISGGDCAVCLSKFEANDLLRLLPLCCHAFHATCIDTWLNANHSCPLCRSPVQFSDSDIAKTIADGNHGSDSFRLEIGSISRRSNTTPLDSVSSTGQHQNSYSMGSFDYVVEDESEIVISQSNRRSVCFKDSVDGSVEEQPTLAAEVAAANNSWLRDFVDRFSRSVSSSTMSFRGSGRFFTGSSRRSEVAGVGDFDLEAVRVGEEISELFSWFAG